MVAEVAQLYMAEIRGSTGASQWFYVGYDQRGELVYIEPAPAPREAFTLRATDYTARLLYCLMRPEATRYELPCHICQDAGTLTAAVATCNELNQPVCDKHAYWCDEEGHGTRPLWEIER
jgi:hypothetical protein